MLKINNLKAYYGAIEALHGIALEVNPGEIRCIIGVNGAGKTTLLKAISGVVEKSGSISWSDSDISEATARKIAQMGIIHVPEGRHVFPGLTVRENLEVSTISWHGFFGAKPYTEDIDLVFSIFPRLQERANQKAWSLSGGEQQMLVIGRALMARPKMLLLDEPSMGLAPKVINELFSQIVRIHKEQNIPILLIEQNARLALRVSSYAYVLDQGNIILEGDAKELRRDPRVVEAYFGKLSKSD
ncbi:MAG: ABC transporter ATP-binding protein [Oscillospiraceae bacterium]|nr:ABC transporter ATP-binding protein [Oscillospiraceae bacterium]